MKKNKELTEIEKKFYGELLDAIVPEGSCKDGLNIEKIKKAKEIMESSHDDNFLRKFKEL